MKKGFTILLSILLLVGCSSEDADQPKKEAADANKVAQTEKNPDSSGTVIEEDNEIENDVDESNIEDTDDIDGSNTEDTDDIDTKNDHLKDFTEFDVLVDKIDLDIYQGVVETDNKGNRIILFENENGDKEYKSIFIKHENRLKIVQFDDDGLIYNEIIK